MMMNNNNIEMKKNIKIVDQVKYQPKPIHKTTLKIPVSPFLPSSLPSSSPIIPINSDIPKQQQDIFSPQYINTLQMVQNHFIRFQTQKAAKPLFGRLKNIRVSNCYQKVNGQKVKILEYKFTIEGRQEQGKQYFQGRCFSGKIKFRIGFPKVLPEIIVDKLKNGNSLMMVNVKENGRVSTAIVDWTNKLDSFESVFSIILEKLENAIYKPVTIGCSESNILNLYKNDPSAYWKFQEKQAQFLRLADD